MRRESARTAAAWALGLALLLPVLANGRPLRVAVVSDLNGSFGSLAYRSAVDDAVARIIALQPDLVLSTGDMVAGQRLPPLDRPRLEAMWAAFHRTVSEPLAEAGIPLAVTVGNHDGSAYPGFARERALFVEQWADRRPALTFVDDAGYPLRYAFALGGILFIALDATRVGALDEEQLAWLDRLLATEGPRHAHRVLFGHLPPWPFAQGREHETIGSAALRELFDAHDVGLYLSGHHHAFYPGSIDDVALVGQACLGASPRRLLGTGVRSRRALTLIELDDAGLRLAALAAPEFERALDWEVLPARVEWSGTRLLRADLAGVASPLARITPR